MLRNKPFRIRFQEDGQSGTMTRARKDKRRYSSFVEYVQANRRTPNWVIVAAVFALVLVFVTQVGIDVVLRVAAVVRMLDVICDLLDAVARRGHIIKWTAGDVWREARSC